MRQEEFEEPDPRRSGKCREGSPTELGASTLKMEQSPEDRCGLGIKFVTVGGSW